MRVLLAGAGTAGHVNPLLSTAKVLRDKGIQVFVLGTETGIETTLVPQNGFELLTIEKLVFPRSNPMRLFSLPFKLKALVNQVCAYIREKQIDVVCGFGGYVSAPAYLAAHKLNIPIVIHEQNAKAGMANKLGARFAKTVALTFETDLKARKGKTFICGMPLREDIVTLHKALEKDSSLRMQAFKFFGLDENRKTMLVTGGSLGALSINSAFTQGMKFIPDEVQVIHLAGRGKAEKVLEAVKEHDLEDRYKVFEYLNDMHYAYACADLIVCRCGATTVAEISALGIPAIYVPLPIGNGEQSLNARGAVEKGAAVMVLDKHFNDLAVKDCVEILLDYKGDRSLEKMRVSNTNAVIDAAQRLAEEICLAGGKR